MDSKTLTNFHRFGKVGKVIMTVFMVVAVLVTVLCLTATIYIATLPKDAMTVRVTNQAEFRINENNFHSFWGFLVNNFSYVGNETPKELLRGGEDTLTPPEEQDIQTDLSFFDQSYASARISSDGSSKVIKAASSPAKYQVTDLVSIMAFFTLLFALAVAALYILRGLFATLAKCDSPFCNELVKKMKQFGICLLPVALFATISETLSRAFLSAGRDSCIQIQWGILIAFAVTMCLVTVFRYGVQLQKESDETL